MVTCCEYGVLLQIRRGYGYEGKVLYFLDARDTVVGLLKKKTIW